MQLKNTKKTYGWIAIALHWISAVGVIWLYFLGENIEHAKADDLGRDVIIEAIRFHAAIGMLFFVFLLARIISSLMQPHPVDREQHRYLNLLARMVQRLWLLMIGIQIITGPLNYFSKGRAIPVFDWFTVPSPIAANDRLHEINEFIHATAPNLFWPLLVLHVVGAAKHLFIDRDDVVRRMVVPKP